MECKGLARAKLETQPADIAARFRQDVRRAMQRTTNATVAAVKLNGVSRSTRWVARILADGTPLASVHAVELAERLFALGIRLPEDLHAKLRSPDQAPMLLIPPDEAENVAKFLAHRIIRVKGVSPAAEARIAASLKSILAPFEQFNETPIGKEIWPKVISELGPGDRARWVFEQMIAGKTLPSGEVVTPRARVMLRKAYESQFPKTPVRSTAKSRKPRVRK